MKRYILGYVTDRALPSVTEQDARRLTHINIAFGLVKKGLADVSHLKNLSCLPQIKAWNNDIQFVLSVGGWGAGGFSDMSLSEGGRRAFAESCREICDKYALDGIDIDWEYPCNACANIDADQRDKENFTLLLQALRDALGDRIVSIAAGALQHFIHDTDMESAHRPLDYVQLMTYDMRSGFCTEAGHHTALYPSLKGDPRICTASTVEAFHEAGVPYEKIIIGAAFYSRHWSGVPDVDHGMFQQAATVGTGGPRYTALVSDYIDQNGWTRYYDEAAQASWLYKDGELLSYDDELSIAAKCEYLKRKGLLGIMYWEHGCDETRRLLGVMAKELHDE